MKRSWKLYVIDRPDAQLVGTENEVTTMRDYLTDHGIECYRYTRRGDFAPWTYVG